MCAGAADRGGSQNKHDPHTFTSKEFERLMREADLTSHVTFAYCRLDRPYQKYTTLYYTPELGTVLDKLNDPAFKCDHEPGTHANLIMRAHSFYSQ